jgi:hypothetical protein
MADFPRLRGAAPPGDAGRARTGRPIVRLLAHRGRDGSRLGAAGIGRRGAQRSYHWPACGSPIPNLAKGEAMPQQTPSELLTQLAHKAKEAEDAAAAARAKNHAALEARRKAIETSMDEADAKLEAEEEHVVSKWSQMDSTLHKHLAEKRASIKADIETQKAARDTKRAAKRADHAEEDALLAVGLALDAIETAEYEVIDAVLARAEAEDLVPA